MSNTQDNSRREVQPLGQRPSPEQPPSPPTSLEVELIVDAGAEGPVDAERLREAAVAAARYRGARCGQLGVRVTDDAHIHRLNRDHLDHDYPTDVISFGYAWQPPRIEGELVASAETARREAARLGWQPSSELILYVVHGVLHIAGMLDATPPQRAAMRHSEREVLQQLGIDQLDRFGADSAGNAGSESEPAGAEAPPAATPRRGDTSRERFA